MSKSTTIEWKDGKDISKSQLKQKQDDQQANKRKRHYETKTFFDWFSDNSDPVNDDIAELFKGKWMAGRRSAFEVLTELVNAKGSPIGWHFTVDMHEPDNIANISSFLDSFRSFSMFFDISRYFSILFLISRSSSI